MKFFNLVPAFLLAGSALGGNAAMAQAGQGKISTIGYWCERFGGDWSGSRCVPPGNNPASNLLPAMNNISSRANAGWLVMDVQPPSGNDYLKVVYGSRTISFRRFTPSQLQANAWRLHEPELATRLAFMYQTNAANLPYVALYQDHGLAPEVLGSGMPTTPVHGGAVPLHVPARCHSFPSCIVQPEQDPNFYKGRAGNAAFSAATNPHWTHDPIPDSCNPYKAAFVPPYVVDGLVFAELRNDLRYLTESNLQALFAKGYDFNPLYARDFGDGWMNDMTIIRVNPDAARKPRNDMGKMKPRTGQSAKVSYKTESYYQNLIENRLFLPNPQYQAATCRKHEQAVPARRKIR